MKATELLRQPLNEGGNAFPDVGTIHRSEIDPTLNKLEKILGMPGLKDQVLGSVGKVEYSGDIDIAVDLDGDKMKELSHKLRGELGNQSVKGTAGNIAIRFPIENYDESKQGRSPRTGYVQVDLIPGEPSWMKSFYHSPGEESKLKGVHRNLALTAVSRNIDKEVSDEEDSFGRPVEEVRWSFGPKFGLHKVRKTSRWSEKDQRWLKKQATESLSDPVKDPNKIASILFGDQADASDMNSVEAIIDAVKRVYDKQKAEVIFKEIARTFSDHGVVEGFDMPPEIERYLG